jgi:hypothetical protein
MATPAEFATALVDYLVQGVLIGAFLLGLTLLLPSRGS